MNHSEITAALVAGDSYLGIELGSTRIKAVLIAPDHSPIASGDFGWENQLLGNIWTYPLDLVWTGLQTAYANLVRDVQEQYNVQLTRVASMGFSAMMHGYLPFDKDGALLTPFRTWRNTMTGQAAAELTELFQFNIPQRWSIAHLHQAILNEEPHVEGIAHLTTLAGYVHWKLTGEKVLGIGEASGMFPIDSTVQNFDQAMIAQYDGLIADRGLDWKLDDILPQVRIAGQGAGQLTAEGAKLLDPTGTLEAGIPLCPPEGDAGTGMTATNAVAPRTGNVSAGTSIFAMVVLEKALSKLYPEIDMVTTPTGSPVAMVHCNNCTNEINAWAAVFSQFLTAMGHEVDKNKLFTTLFQSALDGAADGGNLTLYNYLSGESVTNLDEGRPLFVRTADGDFNFENFMRVQLYSALATLNIGLDILAEEAVTMDRLMGHGGFFKTPQVGQQMMAAATGTPVSVMETAGEGGPWGMAILAAFLVKKAEGQSLDDYLSTTVFGGQNCVTVEPVAEDVAGFAVFMERYRAGLAVERLATERI